MDTWSGVGWGGGVVGLRGLCRKETAQAGDGGVVCTGRRELLSFRQSVRDFSVFRLVLYIVRPRRCEHLVHSSIPLGQRR